LETRYQDVHLPLTLQNGTNFEVGSNPSTDVIFTPFTINRRRGIVIAPGRYDYNEWFYMGRFNPAARLSYNLRFGHGSFYDGYRKNFEAQTTARLNEMLNVTMSLSRNLIDLKAGSYTTNLITSRINATFSTRMFLNALLQYNTDARQWTSNIRFNVIHRPLSDIFLVFNESRDSRSNDLLDRSIAAKITYMLAF